MPVTVLIDRTFKPEGLQKAYEVIVKLRSLATLEPGYISGQTLVSTTNPNRLVVMSTWATVQNWNQWRDSELRKQQVQKLEPLSESPEKVDVLMVVV
ncbi:MAG: antibiotic biosynthesis monooxygenase [Thermodesulfobacteriota bacterium]